MLFIRGEEVEMKKKLPVVAGMLILGLICLGIGIICSFRRQNADVDTPITSTYSYDIFPSVTFDGAAGSEDIPWKYTAGIFDMDWGRSILLTPNTAVNLQGTEGNDLWSFEYRIHPWVNDGSDGAGLVVWILDDRENILFSDELYVDSQDDWQEYHIELNTWNSADKIRILCNNGRLNNDECDWIIIRGKEDEPKQFSENYVRSATYFSDEWPINFWNCEMDHLSEDFMQIKSDGFDSVIIVIPWREFQPGLSPISYNEYAFDNLKKVMETADSTGLKVYTRIGYTWDFYNDEKENIVDRYFRLLGDANALSGWDAYVEKMYSTLSSYECFAGAFLTWEDFWNSLGICDSIDPNDHMNKSAYIGYGQWVSEHYSLDAYNAQFQTTYATYDEIPIPFRSEPAMWAMYEFFDDFLLGILTRSQQHFPNISMEVRMDWDLVFDKIGSPIYYKHDRLYTCADSDFTTTMYGIPMGFENTGERVSYSEALEKTKYILEKFQSENGGKPVYIDQFIFADNTPAFSNNAQIREEELEDYLLNIAGILRNHSDGYGIWTYRNYCANMIYNPQFVLNGDGWNSQNTDFTEINGSMCSHIMQAGVLEQKVPDIRNHFVADKYVFELDVVKLNTPGTLEIQVGNTVSELPLNETGKVQLTVNNPLYFDIKIKSIDADVCIDNLKLYSQIQQGYLYDENMTELECIDEIRILNNMLGAD